MNTYRTFAPVTALALLLMTGVTPASAQQPSAVGPDVLGFAGVVSDGGGTTFGGGVQYPINDRLVAAAEAGYLTGGKDFSGFGVDVDLHAISVDANLHYQFPLSGNPRFKPYALGGVGFLRASASLSTAGFSTEAADTTVGLNIGGGALWQVTPKWGVRPELKVLVADGSSVRFSTALSYRFGG